MAGKVTLTEVKTGIATVEDLMVLNDLMDMQVDIEAAQIEKAKES